MHQHHHIVFAVLALDREGRDIAATQRLDLLGRPFDILRPDIAAIVQDQVLGAAGDDDFAVEPVAHVAGIEEAVGADAPHRVASGIVDNSRPSGSAT